jgi:hypothetical protein
MTLQQKLNLRLCLFTLTSFLEEFFHGCLKKGIRDLLEITGKKQSWNGPFKIVFLNKSAIEAGNDCNVP